MILSAAHANSINEKVKRLEPKPEFVHQNNARQEEKKTGLGIRKGRLHEQEK
jgi:hypothetical protein